MNTQGLYVPPEGAMQFGFYPEFAEMYGENCVWVLGTLLIHATCGGQCFAVLNPSRKVQEVWSGNGAVKVCECRGKIIE